jgi:hypothetical protein
MIKLSCPDEPGQSRHQQQFITADSGSLAEIRFEDLESEPITGIETNHLPAIAAG